MSKSRTRERAFTSSEAAVDFVWRLMRSFAVWRDPMHGGGCIYALRLPPVSAWASRDAALEEFGSIAEFGDCSFQPSWMVMGVRVACIRLGCTCCRWHVECRYFSRSGGILVSAGGKSSLTTGMPTHFVSWWGEGGDCCYYIMEETMLRWCLSTFPLQANSLIATTSPLAVCVRYERKGSTTRSSFYC